MKKILSFTILLFFVFSLFANSIVKGKIVDENSQQPIDYANITIFKLGKGTPIYGGISDINGQFKINSIPNGKYTLQISFIGYHIFAQDITINENDINIGIIRLKEDSKLLSEIEIIGQGSQMRFEIDRKVFSVDQNIATAGGSATEILENIPSVEVDQDGNISLRNNESVEVWINGRPSGLTAENRAEILQQMPAESIESIEIITNPSAKYNPEGTAGVINLVLKKNRKNGYYGNITAGMIYPDGGTPGGNISGNINFNSSKIDTYINLGYRQMKREGGSWSDLLNFNPNELIHQNNKNSSTRGGLFIRTGISYYLNDKNTLSLSGFGISGRGKTTSLISYSEKNTDSNILNRAYNRKNIENATRSNFNANLDYKHDFNKKGNELLAGISYSKHNHPNEKVFLQTNSFPNNTTSEFAQNSDRANEQLQIKIDYINKVTNTGKLEAGLQSDLQKRYSDSDGFDRTANVVLDDYYNMFDYKEQIHAAYVTYGEHFFENFSFQVGLRGEYMGRDAYYADINTNKFINYNSYFELFPSLFLGYAITKRDEIQLNYTRRVNRPRGWEINPFRNYSDSTNITYGNKNLNPEFSSAFEFNYLKNWDNHSLSSSLYYRFTDNVIQRVSYKTLETMESTFMNISQSNNTGLELILKNRLFRILNLTTSANLYYSKIDSASYITPYGKTEFIKREEGFSWEGRIMANFMFTNTFSGQLTGRYNSPRIIAQGRLEADYSVDLGLRKSFFNRNLNININVRDLFNSRKRKSSTSGNGFEKYSESYWHGRTFGLTISYNFGNIQSLRNAKKNNSNNESNMEIELESID